MNKVLAIVAVTVMASAGLCGVSIAAPGDSGHPPAHIRNGADTGHMHEHIGNGHGLSPR